MKKWILLLSVLVMLMPLSPAKAQAELSNRKEVFAFLEKAFLAQVSLSEKDRSMAEFKKVLSPYFSEGYQSLFIKENAVEEKGKYRTYGSDFAKYFIPFFRFSENTKVVIENKKIYVFEFFPSSTEGPVGYKDHYEGLLLEEHNGQWKVSEDLYDNIPKRIIEKAGFHNKKTTSFKAKSSFNDLETASLQIQMGFNPIGTFMQYGAMVGLGKKETLYAIFKSSDLKEKLALQ